MQTTTEPYKTDSGTLSFRYHDGQKRAMASKKRFILLLAGSQSGKTVIGPWWLFREICRKGPGDYLIACPSFQLMNKKVLPEFLGLFNRRLHLGQYKSSEYIFEFSARGQEVAHGTVHETPTRVFFGHAQNPDSLESATAKAAWLDEAGQRMFKLGSWEAIQRRLSIHQGRVLISTTPYTLGWLKSQLHDRAREGHPEIDLIQFESTMNPVFPQAEFDRMRQTLPRWKFDMMYRGVFRRPAGMIYDCFDEEKHLVPRCTIPEDWPRHLGLDFGGVNTAGIYLANEPGTNRYVLYRTYHAGGRTAKEHAQMILRGEPIRPRACGGAWSEDQWRDEFAAAGLPVRRPPIKDVEVGIDRVYAMLKARVDDRLDEPHLEIFDDLADIIDQIQSYSRALDDNDEPTEKIEDKETYHLLDALRYKASEINTHVKPMRPALI